MAYESWSQAADKLLKTVGIENTRGDLHSPEDISAALRGSGFDFRRVNIVNQTIPVNDRIVGGILGQDNGPCLPFISDSSGINVLPANNDDPRPLTPQDTGDEKHAWLLMSNPADVGNMASFVQRHGSRLMDLLGCALVVNLLALTLPLYSSFVYDKILGNGIPETLWALVVAMGIIMGIEFCVRVIRLAIAERFAVNCDADIDHAIFRKVMDVNPAKLPPMGELLGKYKEVLSYRDFLSSSYLLAMADIPFILLFMVAIAFAAGPLVFVSIVCGLLMLGISVLTMRPIISYEQQSKKGSEERFSLISEIIMTREAVIGSAMRNNLLNQWRQSSVSAGTATSRMRFWLGLNASLMNGISFASYVAILAAGAYMVEHHTLTGGGLLAASMLNSRMMNAFSSIVTLVTRYREFKNALKEMDQLMPTAPQMQTGLSYGKMRGTVRLDHIKVSLRQGDRAVLNDLSLTIPAGQTVGIAGVPGAGKTTLLRLIAGVLKPSEGHILIDDIPVSQISQQDITHNIGFKPQDLCLFDGTIEDNILAGRAALSPQERQDLLELTGLGRVFSESGLNWKTDTGGRGGMLSGGQRQLVALGRALLRRPTLLLLDEPTNGLDAPLEAHLAQRLQSIKGSCTMIISSHSRSLLSLCDRIIVIGDGRILADGPRDKVLVS